MAAFFGLALGLLASRGAAAAKPALTVDSWGADSFRVRVNLDGAQAYNGPGALGDTAPTNGHPTVAAASRAGPWINGNIGLKLGADGNTLTMSRGATPVATLSLSFEEHSEGDVRNLTTLAVVSAGKNTSYFGFGEHENGVLNQRGLSYDMESCIEYGKSRGGEVCLPWVIVADNFGEGTQVQFGLLWNNPSYGNVSFGTAADGYKTNTWVGHNLDQVDLFVTTYAASSSGTGPSGAADLLCHYVDATGHAPPLPDWAAGYIHSKNRYKSQNEVLDTMKVFADNYSIPVALFVIDYFNWAVMGNLTFDPQAFPDPKAMVDTVKGYGTKLMVSTWPFSQGKSKSYGPLAEQGFAVFSGTNRTDAINWPDGVCGKPCELYDASNPAARDYWWRNIKSGYFDYGIDVFRLDAAEPEQMGGSPPGSSWSVGAMERVGMMFPYYHTQTYFDGMTAAGATDFLTLSRSAWAGMQKHRAALWNGDTHSDFSYLKTAIQAGQNIQLSGIAWWTTDIGGYAGGDPTKPDFRELIVRWFQFGFTCPLFRQHGARPTEPWLLGNETFGYVREVMALRETFKPYVLAQLAETARSGLPLNRPLWFDAPSDAATWDVNDQYYFGQDYMAAPVYVAGARNRTVYFPKGASWTHHFTGKVYRGGTMATIPAPINEFPLFKKAASVGADE